MIYGARITHPSPARPRPCPSSSVRSSASWPPWSGGWFDMFLSRFVDLLMAIPTLIFGAGRAVGAAVHLSP
jgi:hypothetical protein